MLPMALIAQEDKLNIRFDNISIKDGLSQSSPNCIFQDSRGLLWIGTEDGLNKYDGYSFIVYKPEQNDQFSISNPRILSICEDADATLWIGTNGGGLNKYDRRTNRFYRFRHGKEDSLSLSGSLVYALIPVSETELWIGTEQGLSVFDLKTSRFTDSGTHPVLNPLSETAILSFARDNSLIWIGTDKGLYCYDQDKKILTNYQTNPEDIETLPDNRVTALLADKSHNLWAGTENGLAILKTGFSSFSRISDLSSPGFQTSNNSVKALLEDDKGNIWIGTFGGGLYIITPQSGKIVHLIYDYNNPYSLSNNEVLSLYMDLSGIIWVGTNGLDKYNPKKEKFTLFDYVPYSREKLVFRNIHPIYEDAESILWVGSKTDGLHILDRKNKSYSRMVHEPGNPNSLSSSRIRYIKEHPRGTLWIGTDDQGLNKVILNGNRKPVRFASYRNIPGNPNSLTSNKIYAIYPDFENRLWIGTDNGLTVMDIASETFTQYTPDPDDPNCLSNLTVYCIYGDRVGNIWLATDFGINRFDPSTGGFIHYTHNENDTSTVIYNEILSFYEDNQGNLWVGTYGKGLDKFDMKKQTFTHFTGIRQLSTAVIYGILQDDQENLWLSTNNGIIKFNPARGEINQFSIEDGLQSNEFNGTSYYKSLTGEMFFGGQYGFNSFFPNAVVKDSVSPRIILSDLQVGNSSISPGDHSPIGQHINEVKEIMLNHRQNNFTLYFSALHFANPMQNHYKYRLVGFDKDWIDAGTRRFVSYTSLPYKSYVFRVIASNSDGIWNETGLEVKIRINPPFWATLWFRIFMIVVILAGAYFLVKRRLTVVQRQKQVFEEKFQASSKELQEALEQLEVQHEEIVVQKRELKLRQKDQENLLWFNHGLGMFSDIISKNRDDVTQLCNIFIQKLVEYVEVEQGGVFLINDDQEDQPFLELAGSYAFSAERAGQQFLPGEGYIGTCYTSREFMEIDNLTDQYSEVRSGLGNDYVKHLLLAPLKINDQCIGVVELGSFKKIRGYRVSFVEKLMETFASIINTERANTKLKKLIDHSTFQAKELAESEEQLRLNLEEIMATQEESTRREDELIKLAEEAATREEMLNHEIEELKNRIEALTRQRQIP
jgi:ligand-binding sensor domain-containing protein